MKKLVSLAAIFSVAATLNGQDCKAYIPQKEGTVIEMETYNKKDKLTGITKQELTKVVESGSETVFHMKQLYTDEKGKNPMEAEMEFTCKDGVFYIDMNTMINQEQMLAYEEMEMEVEMTEMEFPSDMKPGQKLNDGVIQMKIISESPMSMSFTVSVTNRTVSAIEKVTTPAGTFECYKIEQDIETKSMFTVVIQSVTWYAEGVGAVRSENYSKGNLIGYTVISNISKP